MEIICSPYWTLWWCDSQCSFVFGRFRVQILIRRPTILTEVLLVDFGSFKKLRSFIVHKNLTIHRFIPYPIEEASLNKPSINQSNPSVRKSTMSFPISAITARRNWVASTRAPYSGGPRFKYRPGDGLTWLMFCVGFLSPYASGIVH
jgi:hypothetical protein